MKATITTLFLTLLVGLNAQTERYISETPIVGLNQLDSIVKNYTIFFTGENHTYTKENNHIELEMLKYLNKQVNVQHFIIELGYARGYMLNAYINDDTSYFKCLRATTATKYIELYKALRTLNQSLPIEKRIQVHGVDVERFTDDAPILLSALLPKNTEVPKAIEFEIEVLKTFAEYAMTHYNKYSYATDEPYNNIYSYSYYNDKWTIDSIINQYKAKRLNYETYLGANYATFEKVMNSLVELRKWQGYAQLPHQIVFRERSIYDNISLLMKQYPEGKFYGQFGRCHTGFGTDNTCNWYKLNSTAIRLNEGIAKGKTLSIGLFYNVDKKSVFENSQIDEELKSYLLTECSGTSILTKVASSDTFLIKQFPYILYNNPCGKGKSSSNKSISNNSVEDVFEWATLLDFGYGQSKYNFGRINQNMKLPGKGFNNLVESISLGYSYSDFGNYNVGRLDVHITQKSILNNTHFTLSGYNIMEGYGYCPHISNRFTIAFYGLLAYNRMTLLIEDDSVTQSAVVGFSPIKRHKFRNDAISVGAGIDFRFAITQTFSLFARSRYLIDLSKRYWNNTSGGYGMIDANSPPFSHSNANVQVGFSINVGY